VGNNVESVIKFHLSNKDVAAGVKAVDSIKSAHLRLYANEGCGFAHHQLSDQLGLFSVGLASANGDAGAVAYGEWEGDAQYEMVLTWDNAPTQLSSTSGKTVLYQPLGELNADSWFEVDVTSLVTHSIIEGTDVTLRIGSTLFVSNDSILPTLSSCNFASKELDGGRFAPELVLQVDQDTTWSESTRTTADESSTMKQARQVGGITNRKSITHEKFSISQAPPAPSTITTASETTYNNASPTISTSTTSETTLMTQNSATTNVHTMTQHSSVYNTNNCAPQYESRSFNAGETVSSVDGKNYECKPHPFTSWCSFEAYAPGRSDYWHMAWLDKGDCTSNQAQNYLGVNDIGFTGTCPDPPWQLHHTYKAGERVTSYSSTTTTGSASATIIVYECKEYPFTASCGDPAAEVGSGPIYRNVWRVVGVCDEENGRVIEGSVANSGTPLETNLSKREEPTRRPTTTRPTPNSRPNTNSRPSQYTSGSAQIMVRPAPDGDDCEPQFQRNKSYCEKAKVSFRGSNYQCTLPKFCDKNKFEPAKGKYWTLVWEDLGSCNSRNGGSGSVSENSPASTPGDRPARPQRPTATKPATKPEPAVTISAGNEDTSANLILDGQQDDGEDDDQACPPLWALNYDYSEGETVGANWQVYRCKGHPQTAWCGDATLYEPGVGTHWAMAWDMVGNCEGMGTRQPTPPPTPNPTRKPTAKSPNGDDSSFSNNFVIAAENVESTVQTVFDILDSKSSLIDSSLFLYQGKEPSKVYRYEGFISGLRIMVEDGVAGKQFYLGNGDPDNGHLYGLVNIAAFIGQSMKETIQYDACDENSWDYFNMVYPLSNACGQLGQSYQDYHCPEHEKHMECEVDPNMSIKATTHAKWYGAPGPMFCGPKSEYPETGIWDYNYNCNNPWAEPPEYCTDYDDQKAGRVDNTVRVANRNGRTDVEGCCWWGRGVIQTTGVCNFGKLNYFLGKRADDEGRDSRYPEIDFCKDPGIICSSEEHKELKWIAGMFYWIESLQSYDEGGWNYMNELHNFVDNGMADHNFINAVSGIVNRGCHNPPCGTGAVDGSHERAGNFNTVLSTLNS